MSVYRFLQPHSIGQFYYEAGSIASTSDVLGGTLPIGWVPSGNSEPMDAAATVAFFPAGAQLPSLIRSPWMFVGPASDVLEGQPKCRRRQSLPRIRLDRPRFWPRCQTDVHGRNNAVVQTIEVVPQVKLIRWMSNVNKDVPVRYGQPRHVVNVRGRLRSAKPSEVFVPALAAWPPALL